MHHLLFPILRSALLLILGLFAGSIITAWSLSNPAPIAIMHDESGEIPSIEIEGIRNGALIGSVRGGVSIKAGDKPVIPDASGAFMIRDASVLTNVIHIDVPDGMHFVASKKGKKYYPIDSKSGRNIVPQNRVYFKSEDEAKKAGYVR
jgi:hypothetical protein